MTNNIKAEDLTTGTLILDPEGNTARVTRLRRIDHERGRLETDRGIRIVALDDTFPLA